MKTLQEREQYWHQLLYTERKEFPGEYVLRVRPIDMAMVRIYEDGHTIQRNPVTSAYHAVEEKP